MSSTEVAAAIGPAGLPGAARLGGGSDLSGRLLVVIVLRAALGAGVVSAAVLFLVHGDWSERSGAAALVAGLAAAMAWVTARKGELRIRRRPQSVLGWLFLALGAIALLLGALLVGGVAEFVSALLSCLALVFLLAMIVLTAPVWAALL